MKYFVLAHQEARNRAKQAIADADDGEVVRIMPPTRSLEQNALLWAVLGDVAAQVDWYGRKLSPEDWKNVFSASLRKLEVVPNIDGTGFVALGQSTSKMTKAQLSDLIELIYAFGSERGVRFGDVAQ